MFKSTSGFYFLPADPAVASLAIHGDKQRLAGFLCAAPLLCAALWAVGTGAAALCYAMTGSTQPLDWFRSGGGLAATAVLTGVSLLVGSALNGMTGRRRTRHHGAFLLEAERPLPADVRTGNGWRLEEGSFTPV